MDKIQELHDKISPDLIKYCWAKAGLLNLAISNQVHAEINRIPVDQEDDFFEDIDEIYQLEEQEQLNDDDDDDVVMLVPVK